MNGLTSTDALLFKKSLDSLRDKKRADFHKQALSKKSITMKNTFVNLSMQI
jgi:hypothetical protein